MADISQLVTKSTKFLRIIKKLTGCLRYNSKRPTLSKLQNWNEQICDTEYHNNRDYYYCYHFSLIFLLLFLLESF